MFQMEDNETKPTKRRDYTNQTRKNRKDGPKAPRHNRKEKHKVDPLSDVFNEWCDDQEEIDDLLDDVLGPR